MLLMAGGWQHKYTMCLLPENGAHRGLSNPSTNGGLVRSDDNNVILQQQASHSHDVPEAQICTWLMKVMSFHSI